MSDLDQIDLDSFGDGLDADFSDNDDILSIDDVTKEYDADAYIEEYADANDFMDSISNPTWAPEPREGMVQRWVRMTLQNDHDGKNVNAMRRIGWVPRSISSLNDKDRMTLGLREGDGEDDGLIRSGDVVLCEMEQRRAAAINKHLSKFRKDREDRIKGRIDSFNSRIDETDGFSQLRGGTSKVAVSTRSIY